MAYLLLLQTIICFLVIFSAYGNEARVTDEELRVMLKDLLTNYDPRLRPNYTGNSVSVIVDVSIMSFGKLDTMNMAFTLDIFLRQRWRDHRLKHNLTRPITIAVGTKHPADMIWVPDTLFINSVESKMHHVTVNNHKLDIHPNGTVFWGTRVTVSPSCKLDLRSYPMDTQNCEFLLVSYTHANTDLVYAWKSEPGVVILDKTMSQFELTNYRTKDAMVNYVAGVFSVLTAQFTFERLMGYSILRIYIPCVAVVCVSWISLWIRRTSTPARVALCITTLLTVATLWGSANSTLPRVNYIKAVDIYLLTSFVFVLCTLIEYVIVLNCENIIIKRRVKKKKSITQAEKILLQPISEANTNELSSSSAPEPNPSYAKEDCVGNNGNIEADMSDTKPNGADKELADFVEYFARIFFLVIYIAFNCIYWSVYYTFPN